MPRAVKGGGDWFEAVVEAPPARQGENYVLVRPGPGCMGNPNCCVEDARIWVRYAEDGKGRD